MKTAAESSSLSVTEGGLIEKLPVEGEPSSQATMKSIEATITDRKSDGISELRAMWTSVEYAGTRIPSILGIRPYCVKRPTPDSQNLWDQPKDALISALPTSRDSLT